MSNIFTNKTTKLRTTYKQLLNSAGEQAPKLRNALLYLFLAAAVQGLAFGAIYPLMLNVFMQSTQALNWLIGVTLLMLIATVFRWLGQSFDYNGDMLKTTHVLRTKLGQQLRKMPLLDLQSKRSGEINSTVLGNVDENLMYSLTILGAIFNALITPLVASLVVIMVEPRIGLLMLLIFPALVPFYYWRRPALARGTRYLAEANAKTSADIVEYMQGLPVMRAACCEGAKAQTLQASFAHLQQVQKTGHQKSGKPNLIITSIMELGLLILSCIAIYLVTKGSLSLAIAGASTVVLVRFAEPLATFINYVAIMELIETALQRVENLLNIKPLAQIAPPEVPTKFEITFEDVSFVYPEGENKVLTNINLHIPANSMTALVGASGSGKSTLIRMILRHFDPQKGFVKIGGVDLRQIAPNELNNLVAVVFQDVYLFDDTILANIQMARPSASFSEVKNAAKMAQCLDFIERLPNGWQTRLGASGGKLSGGERQRISIVRAFLKDAPIIILDEPTAALDTISELAVQSAIDTLVQNKTVIVIAHRLSTISAADQIAVFDNGQIVELGNHFALLEQENGRYQMQQFKLF